MTEQWALVTGGSRNIGEGIAERLKADGFRVAVSSRSDPEHKHFDDFIRADFNDPTEATATISAAVGDRVFTRFVHNAAVSDTDTVDKVSIEAVSRLYSINTVTFVALSQALLPMMRQAGVGRIVAIGSRAARGKIGRVAYAGSKSALSGIVRSMALELGGDGITVNIVSPGPIETSLFRNSTLPGTKDYRDLTLGIPAGFIGDPADVAHAVAYFLSDEARFCTGQELYVCGGTSIGFVSTDRAEVKHRFADHFPRR